MKFEKVEGGFGLYKLVSGKIGEIYKTGGGYVYRGVTVRSNTVELDHGEITVGAFNNLLASGMARIVI